ncbi:bacillithiol biosynthesis cysteine-adding enzyme BshC [Longibacter salinarum]|uniref:Putative cysteine ligase BshC n=1 Tax=Longibacter salinarum TaxID=1850348 RepID=A0A2A8CYM5_9BACT|nr:bacillithiol biosynthesis cysteine-adding enzyme BshC [Longibacter salinarum]PEN13704.1 bacillithiol biosynthesis cysteine-adding enzyme BshC [Longibacter salinarum]
MPTRTLPSVQRISLSSLNAFPDLFVDVAERRESALRFYDGDWKDPAARKAKADRVAAQPADRDVLADALMDHNAEWSEAGEVSDAVRKNIDRLRDPESVAVVTGQQVGLLSGPLYTIYKTITTLQLAEEMAADLDRPVVPVFWVEGEDHDFEEIAHASFFHRNELVDVDYPTELEASPDAENVGPVGRLPLDGRIDTVLGELDEILPPSDFKPEIMSALRQAYAQGTCIEDAFARLIRHLFRGTGLVLMNPDDPKLKALVRPLFRRDLTDSQSAVDAIQEASADLKSSGYHAQVHAAPTNLFLLEKDGRLPIDVDEDRGGFTLRGTGRHVSEEEMLDRLETAPEDFSPNVVLRPLMQDALLPTAAYVAGPGEVSYFAQYRGVYEWAELTMPLIHPRASVSLVESKVQSVLDAFDLSVSDLTGDVEQLFQEIVVRQMDVDVDAVFGEALAQIHGAINDLKPAVEDVDRTLVKSAEAARAAIAQEMSDLKQRVVRAEKRQHDEVRAKLSKARVNLVPEGGLQERRINVHYFLNKYSPDLLDDLRSVLSTDTSSHQVVML